MQLSLVRSRWWNQLHHRWWQATRGYRLRHATKASPDFIPMTDQCLAHNGQLFRVFATICATKCRVTLMGNGPMVYLVIPLGVAAKTKLSSGGFNPPPDEYHDAPLTAWKVALEWVTSND